jgi:hypothetical protein
LVVSAILLSHLTSARAEVLGSMDVFGLAPGSIAELERCFGAATREFAAASGAGNPSRARELEADLERRIKEAGGFQGVEISVVHYFKPSTPSNLTFNITVVGKKPVVEYLPEPKEGISDPDGLLASWQEYEKLGSALDFDGQIADSPPCPAHHCAFGFDHPKLRPYGELFSQKVPLRRVELVKVLNADRDPKKRAAAAYLLAHLTDAREVLSALLPRMRDPAASPRNSVLRVLGYMAEHGEGGSIPVAPVLPFLRSLTLTDRNKAVGIVAALSADKKKQRLLVRGAGCDLARLLELKQPNQVDFAREALVKLRGSDLESSTPEAWRSWLKTQGVSCRSDELLLKTGSLCPLPPPSPGPSSGTS